MSPARRPDYRGQTRTAVSARYAGLARAAQAGQAVTDCDPAEFAAGRFGPAGHPDTGGLPQGAMRPVWAAATRSRWRTCAPGETVMDLGCGGGLDVLLSARRVGPSGKACGLDMTGKMLDLARPTHGRPARATPSSCSARSRRSRCRTARST